MYKFNFWKTFNICCLRKLTTTWYSIAWSVYLICIKKCRITNNNTWWSITFISHETTSILCILWTIEFQLYLNICLINKYLVWRSCNITEYTTYCSITYNLLVFYSTICNISFTILYIAFNCSYIIWYSCWIWLNTNETCKVTLCKVYIILYLYIIK